MTQNTNETEVVVVEHDQVEKLVTKAESLVRDGYAPDVWLLCKQLLGTNSDDMVIQLRNEEGDNWLVREKGLGNGVIQQDCIYVQVGHETESAVLIEKFGVGTVDGLSMRGTAGDIWLPKSQITTFRLKE